MIKVGFDLVIGNIGCGDVDEGYQYQQCGEVLGLQWWLLDDDWIKVCFGVVVDDQCEVEQ